MPRPLRVFLCHASQDKPAVRKMYAYLKQHGVQPWLDREDLLPGQDWEVEIPKALFASDVILVCLSTNSVNKEGYVQKEIAFALDKAMEKPQGTIFIIPVKLEECNVPSRLSRYQWVDYYRADGRKRLLMSLNMRAQGLGDDVYSIIIEDTRKMKSSTRSVTREDENSRILDLDKAAITSTVNVIQEMAEVIADEKVNREIQDKAEFEGRKRDVAEKPEEHQLLNPQVADIKSTSIDEIKKEEALRLAQKSNNRVTGIGVIVISVLLLAAFSWNLLIKNFNSTPTDSPITITVTIAKTKTPTPIKTFTPVFLTITPTPGIGSTIISDGVTMMYIPKGSFSMGGEINNDDKPIHAVLLDAYYIDKFEVTNASYERCVEANKCNPPRESRSSTRAAYYGNPEFDEYPVIHVDWERANDYCEWRGDRLPTEAEWEKAARGEDGRTYPWGEVIDCDNANYIAGIYCIGDTTKVGSYLDGVSPYGVYDMAGNVWEWVSDWYDENYYKKSPSSNPLGSELGQLRVLRGGSWGDFGNLVRSAYREKSDPTASSAYFGFRCARSP